MESFGDAGITIRARMKTLPLRQWEVGRALRRRIKQRFDAEGIDISNRSYAMRAAGRTDLAALPLADDATPPLR